MYTSQLILNQWHGKDDAGDVPNKKTIQKNRIVEDSYDIGKCW